MQQLERLVGGLAQVEAGVEHDPVGRDAGRLRPVGPLDQEVAHLAQQVVVVRVGVGDARGEADVGGDDRRARGRAHGQVVGVGEAADVVADDRARGVAGGGDRGPGGVDRQGHVEAGVERLDGRDHPVELLLLGHVGTGAGLDPADVEDVGPFGDQLLGPAEEGVEVPVAPLSKNESGVRLRMPITRARVATS